MKSRNLINTFAVALALSPIVVLLLVWNLVPETISLRFKLNEEIIKEQSRQSLLIATLVVSIVAAGVFLLMRNLKRIDPKVKEHTPVSGFHRIGWLILILLTAFNYYFILTAIYSWEVSEKTLLIFTGLLFALLGNYMSNIKPNFFAGIRLPWTLNDENNWRLTHQLAGKIWFAGGLLIALLVWLLPSSAAHPVFIAGISLMVLIPCIYSYSLHKKKANH